MVMFIIARASETIIRVPIVICPRKQVTLTSNRTDANTNAHTYKQTQRTEAGFSTPTSSPD